ncbi:MAG: peptide-methionine (S)-S-oxide reductase, partial [Stenotrophomonas sp.]
MKIATDKLVAGSIAAVVAGLLLAAVFSLDRTAQAAPVSITLPAPTGAADLHQTGVKQARVVFAGGC